MLYDSSNWTVAKGFVILYVSLVRLVSRYPLALLLDLHQSYVPSTIVWTTLSKINWSLMIYNKEINAGIPTISVHCYTAGKLLITSWTKLVEFHFNKLLSYILRGTPSCVFFLVKLLWEVQVWTGPSAPFCMGIPLTCYLQSNNFLRSKIAWLTVHLYCSLASVAQYTMHNTKPSWSNELQAEVHWLKHSTKQQWDCGPF